jgi:SAM-dependent methyltransferase
MTRQPDPAATFPDHFSAVASAYAAARPTYPPELAAWLAAESPARDLAWDVGCGSGQLTHLLARHFARVTATDASTAQIASARATPGVEFVVAPAEAAPLPDVCCDLVVAAQAAHWFRLPAFYAEVARVARPGALLALVSYGRADVDAAAVRTVLDGFAYGVADAYWPPERALVEAGYRELPFPVPRLAVPALAIEERWTLAQLLAYVGTWSATSALRRARGEQPWLDFVDTMTAVWGEPAAVRRISWPLAIVAGRLR